MVIFRKLTSTSTREELLAIFNEEGESLSKATTVPVGRPLIGRYARQWPALMNSLHMKNWARGHVDVSGKFTKAYILLSMHNQTKTTEPFQTLGRNILEEKATWSNEAFHVKGEFRYLKRYWEWTEDVLSRSKLTLLSAKVYEAVNASLFTYDSDSNIMKSFCEAWCPSTNTLHMSSGEISMTLWDLSRLAGLPILGTLFDEVNPDVAEITNMNEKRGAFVPYSCRFLYHAFHILKTDGDGGPDNPVTLERWIHFWCSKEVKYLKPPLRKGRNKTAPDVTHNPLGDFGAHGDWSSEDDALFARLGISRGYKTEVYLAAHLSCWLCAFVLPVADVGMIRPSTFKMACKIATGELVSLAIPVLASIYRGLNYIAESSQPSRLTCPFPIHFVHGWLAHYFNTHHSVFRTSRSPAMAQFSGEVSAKPFSPREARIKIHKGASVNWNCLIGLKQNYRFVDNANASFTECEYFASIRSSYLTLRDGERFIVEAYCPHRISRQFGFYQDVPDSLAQVIRNVNLNEGVSFWRMSTFSKSFDEARFPGTSISVRKNHTSGYMRWWLMFGGDYLEMKIDCLAPKKKIELAQIDVALADVSEVARGISFILLPRLAFFFLLLIIILYH